MELYYFPECPFCIRVLHAIDRLGIADDIELKDVRRNGAFRSELIDLCGNTQVPTLLVEGEPMRESADIVAFLDRRYGEAS